MTACDDRGPRYLMVRFDLKMESKYRLLFSSVLCSLIAGGFAQRPWMSTDDLENHVSMTDLREFIEMNKHSTTTQRNSELNQDYGGAYDQNLNEDEIASRNYVDCFGLGSLARQVQQMFLNMKPSDPNEVNTHFFFSSRAQRNRVQVLPGEQFGLEWTDFKPERPTVMIVHGFMSHSNASWVQDMTRAFLDWDDVNVIAADWSGGGNTWKYWRAVANTRTVGSEITKFYQQLMQATDAKTKDFHFVGHSLGAHICSYVAYRLGGVSRITGLDPAQPCFITTDDTEKLDRTDADFVDIIHTNGRLLKKIGFGLPEPIGHADFYPNGGMKQPGCRTTKDSWLSRLWSYPLAALQQAICSHGRAYLLFTESLISNNCSFRGHQWNLTIEGVNASLVAACDRSSSCSEMGIKAAGYARLPRADGAYFVLTTGKEPYCPSEWERFHLWSDLLRDLAEGFRLDRLWSTATPASPATVSYADPFATTTTSVDVTTKKSRWWWIG